MSAHMQRPSENELHAYVDEQLDAAHRNEVERWLAQSPDEMARVAAWRRQKAALRAAFDPVLDETPPQRLLRAARPARRIPLRFAAAIGWLAIGGALGYALHGAPPIAPRTLAHSAAIAHAVYMPEVRHPVEVGAEQETHLVQWLSKRLGTSLKVPDFSAQGFDLVGGRLLPGERGPVAQFMYQDAQGRRLTLYVRNDAAENRETAFRYAHEGRIGVFYWLDGHLGYALSGELPRPLLLGIANAAYQQLSP